MSQPSPVGPPPTTDPVAGRVVAAAALGRAVLLGRAAATITAAAGGLLLVSDRWRVVEVILFVALSTGAQIAVLTAWPKVVRAPLPILAADSALVLGVLAISGGSIAYFCYAAGAGAVAGVLLGMRAVPLWAAQAALNFAVAGSVLRVNGLPPDIATFIVAFPMTGAVAGIGAAVATSALVRYVELSTHLVASAQRSAAASERARLARELHDSVTKTLRGVSFAALALPSSLRRHPDLAEQLAGTVSAGAIAADRQARELVEGLRLDDPDRDFTETIDRVCRTWSVATGIRALTKLDAVDPSVPVRYELTRILREALSNVDRHAGAGRVLVHLQWVGDAIILQVSDNGVGFVVPDDLSGLQSAGRFGIIGMAERARTVGGDLRVHSVPGAGTSVTVRVPVSARDESFGLLGTHESSVRPW
jgi:signal transduction histidine kinase